MKTKLSIFCEKIIEAGWLAAVVSVPLFFNIYTARTFEPDKITLLRSIAGIMILAWFILLAEEGRLWDRSTSDPSEYFRQLFRKPLFLPTVLLVLIYIISTIFSISPRVSLWGSYQRLQGTYSTLSYIVVFALMGGHLRSRSQIDRLISIVIITSIPVSLYGVVQRYGLDPLPWMGDVTGRIASTMGNPIFVASYLIMVVPITLSRLILAMTAILQEEDASWGHTILAAIYIFSLALQILAILFSGSRGPMLGVLGAIFIMGILILLVLRQHELISTSLTSKEIFQSIGFLIPLGGISGLLGVIGYYLGDLVDLFLFSFGYMAGFASLGAALGGLIGFLGLYVYMAVSEKGWRWLWLSWFNLGALAIAFVVMLNIRGTALDVYLEPIRQIPYIDRLANVIETEGTGRVRMLIWDASMELVTPHEPLGISEDNVAATESQVVNMLRPIIGYGPESMFNAFAFVYPADLAQVEARGSSADRSHNETMDSFVITGVLGFLTFYFLMISFFYYALRWLGWVPDEISKKMLIGFLIAGGIIGSLIPPLLDTEGNPYTFVPVALPFGLLAGLVLYLVVQGIRERSEDSSITAYPILLIGALGAIVGHFIEVHFVFSIAATYTYFWVYLGLIVGLSRMRQESSSYLGQIVFSDEEEEATEEVEPEEKPKFRRSRRRGRSRSPSLHKKPAQQPAKENLVVWMGSYGLAMAIILMILVFNFFTPQFEFDFQDNDSLSLLWMFTITWLVGLGIILSEAAVRRDDWAGGINWFGAVLLYVIPSLGYLFFYTIAHDIQLGALSSPESSRNVGTMEAANILSTGLIIFYIAMFLLMILFALILSWQKGQNLPGGRLANWWLYPPVIVAILLIIWFKNINIVRADIYLKEGEKYRGAGQWDAAVELHEKAISLDEDEDFHYLMLALDYQLKAQNNTLPIEQREVAWDKGEEIALMARSINPYNPDNTGNMGRYYFTMGQLRDSDRNGQPDTHWFEEALKYFEWTTELAPSNITYHNLWAQTYYIQGNYQKAIDRLQTSISIDDKWGPTWLLLGDAEAALNHVEGALEAHTQAVRLSNEFFDSFFQQRLNFYAKHQQLEALIAALETAAEERPTESRILWGIGHIYNLLGRSEEAGSALKEAYDLENVMAVQQGRQPNQNLLQTYILELANTHFSQGQRYYNQQRFNEAIQSLQRAISIDENYHPAWLLLGDIYAAQGDSEAAFNAHTKAIQAGSQEFFDRSLEQRLSFYLSAEKLEDFITFLEGLGSNDPIIQMAIGQAYRLNGEPEKALPYLKRAVDLDEGSGRSPRELVNIYLEMEAWDQALAIYDSMLEQNPNDVEALSGQAFIYARQGELEKAIEANYSVLQIIPDDYDSLKNLAILYQQNEEFEEALDYAQQAQEVAPEAEASSWPQFVENIEAQLAE